MIRRLVWALLLVLGCTPSQLPGARPIDPPAASASSPAPSTPTAGPLAQPELSADRLDELAAAVPAGATLVVHLPATERVRMLVGAGLLDQAVAGAASALQDSLGVTPGVARALFDGFDGAVLYSLAEGPALESASQMLRSAVVMRFRDRVPVDALLAASTLTPSGELDWAEPAAGARPAMRARWSPAVGLLVLAFQADMLEGAWRAALGTEPSFLSSPAFPQGRKQQAWVWADLHRLSRGEPEPYASGSQLFFALGGATGGEGVGAELDVVQLGNFVPRMGSMFSPPERTVLGMLPAGAQAALGLTTKRATGLSFGDVLSELGRARQAPGLAVGAIATLRRLGLPLVTLDQAIGDELAVGLYLPAPPARRGRGSSGGARASGASPVDLESAVLCGALESPDSKAAHALVGALASWLRDNVSGVRATPGRIMVTLKLGIAIRVEVRPGMIVFGAGEPKRLSALLAGIGRPGKSLQSEESYRAALGRAGPATHVRLFTDYGAIATAGLVDGDPALAALLAGRAAMATLSYRASERGLELAARSESGLEIVGVLGSLAVHGFQRYLASAKAAQARVQVAAMARAALAAYERERGGSGGPAHALCRTASAVPEQVPAGQAIAPSTDADRDFQRGDAERGWPCLGFGPVEPLFYKLEYRAGGAYKGPKWGGPNPGPNGFEVSAEGDLDGDGVTSLYTIAGRRDSPGGSFSLSPMFEHEPLE